MDWIYEQIDKIDRYTDKKYRLIDKINILMD